LLALVVTACTPTARTAGPFAAKGRAAARAVHSAVASDLLVIEATRRGNTTAAYVSVATSAAEDTGSEAMNTFLAIQPPDEDSEQARHELSQLFSFAQDALGDARIAGRRGDRNALLDLSERLAAVDAQLSKAADGEPFATDELSSSSTESEQSASTESGG
jgi:hypothetical protein